MPAIDLMVPQDVALVIVDPQAGLAFGVESVARQTLVGNLQALAKTALAFDVPIVVSISATRVYGGPVMPALSAELPGVKPVDRRGMNLWEDEAARGAVLATGRKRLLFAGLLTEACVSFPVLSALKDGFEVFVVADACGGLTAAGHDAAIRRMEAQGAQPTSWLQVLLEFQRDWTRRETYAAARAVVEAHGGGYGLGLAYARDMISPPATSPS